MNSWWQIMTAEREIWSPPGNNSIIRSQVVNLSHMCISVIIKWTQKVVFTYLYIEKEEGKIRCLEGEKGRGHDIITF